MHTVLKLLIITMVGGVGAARITLQTITSGYLRRRWQEIRARLQADLLWGKYRLGEGKKGKKARIFLFPFKE